MLLALIGLARTQFKFYAYQTPSSAPFAPGMQALRGVAPKEGQSPSFDPALRFRVWDYGLPLGSRGGRALVSRLGLRI